MALLLFVLGCLVVGRTAGYHGFATPEKEDFDAWQTIKQNHKYNLVYRSFEYDKRLGGDAKCVNVRLCEADNATMTAKNRVMYRDSLTSAMKGFTTRATVAKSQGSSTNDIIRYGNADLCDAGTDALTAQYKVVYSNYETCDVLTAFGTNETRCELWVKEGYEYLLDNETNLQERHEEAKVGESHSAGEDIEDHGSADYDRTTSGRIRGLGLCVKMYYDTCGSRKYKIFDKNLCSLSSEEKTTNAISEQGLEN